MIRFLIPIKSSIESPCMDTCWHEAAVANSTFHDQNEEEYPFDLFLHTIAIGDVLRLAKLCDTFSS